MSVTAVKLDDWFMDEPDCQTEVRSNEVDGVSVYQWRSHYTIKLSRQFCGLLAHYPENGTVRTSFTAKTGPSTTINWSATGKKFFCTQDSAPIQDGNLGTGTETQTWEHYSDWEDIPASVYAGYV